jgi:hypothetical protein
MEHLVRCVVEPARPWLDRQCRQRRGEHPPQADQHGPRHDEAGGHAPALRRPRQQSAPARRHREADSEHQATSEPLGHRHAGQPIHSPQDERQHEPSRDSPGQVVGEGPGGHPGEEEPHHGEAGQHQAEEHGEAPAGDLAGGHVRRHEPSGCPGRDQDQRSRRRGGPAQTAQHRSPLHPSMRWLAGRASVRATYTLGA